MPQSLARLHVHLVYSTKHRHPLILDSVRADLHRYQAAVFANLGCHAVLINSVEDHIHVLFQLSRTIAVAGVVEEVKSSSSRWIKTQGEAFAGFAWQAGYGAFAVSEAHVPAVCQYIERQREHHRQESFQDEYRRVLAEQRVPYDERYVWD